MIRKYGIGLIALVIAISAAAFTKPEKKVKPFATHTFYYQPPGGTDYSQSAVQNKANWISNPVTPPTCAGTVKACDANVNDMYTHDVSGVRVFNTTGSVASISATAGSGGASQGYVPQAGSPSVGIDSKDDRN